MRKNKKPVSVRRYTWQDQEFLNSSATRSISISYPDEIEDVFETLIKDRHSPIGYFLKEFEEEARRILKGNNFPIDDQNELWWHYTTDFQNNVWFDSEGEHEVVKDIISLNAIRVLFLVKQIRDDITNGNAELAAANMMKLCFSAFCENFHDEVIRGIRHVAGSKKGGRAPKKEPSFALLVQYAWEKSKRKTALSMWKFLMKELEFSGGDTIIKGCDFEANLQMNRITLFYKNGKSRDIGFSTFQRYFRDFKNNFKKKSQ